LKLTDELPRLRAYARRLCASDNDAQDLVQDTILRALLHEHQFEEGSNLRAWLRQIQLSVFVSRYRRGRREKEALQRIALDPCSWVSPEPPAVPAPTGSGLLRSLRSLPAGFRSVVELVDVGGYEYGDAAAALGIPIGTVMSRLHRARRLLGKELRYDHASTDVPRAA
jgi:RNA polymerase sigma-70 factor (ECF subfamily)